MGACVLYGGGSPEGLNYRILGGLEAPENPHEGDIWLKTEMPITGYTITAWPKFDLDSLAKDEKTQAGHIYIGGGGKNPIPKLKLLTLKAGSLEFVPSRWCQYQGFTLATGHVWKALEMEIFTRGEWTQVGVGWDGEIYWDGEEYPALTGGWRQFIPTARREKRLYATSGYTVSADSLILRTAKPVVLLPGKKYLCIQGRADCDGSDDLGTIMLISNSVDLDSAGRMAWDFNAAIKKIPLNSIYANGEKWAVPGHWGIAILPPYGKGENTLCIRRIWQE